jgi:hypothetical protein
MNVKYSLLLAAASLALCACDDSTDDLGTSLNGNNDAVAISTATFNVASQSIVADSVLSRSTTGYLGKVRDPETGSYVTGDFMTQFNCLEDFYFPDKDSLVVYDAKGNVVHNIIRADSCEIRVFFNKSYGDTLQTMKLTAYEMSKPMNEDRIYYSNFDPISLGYIRTNGIHRDKVYSLTNYNVAENVRDTSNYTPYISIDLNAPYTDADGNTYNNYGTYVMKKCYDNPSNMKNAYNFRTNVVPGFFIKSKSGLGNMAYANITALDVYFKYQYNDSIMDGVAVFWGTEEVLQTTTITNDKQSIAKLAADQSCTYLKTPAGIFTELTLPVDSILLGHENDTISSAKISIQRINNATSNQYALDVPRQVLMIPKDSLYSFFENSEIYNNRNSFLASWGYSSSSSSSAASNAYTFSNIAGMINYMRHLDRSNANWNKVVLVPVSVTTTTSSSSTSTVVAKVTNDMSLTSTRLVKGTTTNSPIKINVIYSKFK